MTMRHPQPTPTPRPRGFSALGARVEAAALAPGLYVVATPIGNLGDVSLRALTTLAAADAILAEDTRVTRRLLDRYDIAAPLVAYHEHNAAEVRPRVLARLAAGEALALVSDAGTPLVSDPGYKLVVDAAAAGVAVFALPGPCAAIAALTTAALPTDRFFFEGFLPAKIGGAARADRGAGGDPGDAGVLRIARPARRGARRSRRRARAAAGGGGARIDQAARGDAPRDADRARRPLRRRRRAEGRDRRRRRPARARRQTGRPRRSTR